MVSKRQARGLLNKKITSDKLELMVLPIQSVKLLYLRLPLLVSSSFSQGLRGN
jgi:hypothetical protein